VTGDSVACLARAALLPAMSLIRLQNGLFVVPREATQRRLMSSQRQTLAGEKPAHFSPRRKPHSQCRTGQGPDEDRKKHTDQCRAASIQSEIRKSRLRRHTHMFFPFATGPRL
jgi:hypothetical protein